MYRLVIFSLFAHCVSYVHSMNPLNPSRQLGPCYRLIDAHEPPGNGRLGLVDSDVVHVCLIQGSLEEFCLVITNREISEYLEFKSRDAKLTFMKSMEYTEMVVFQKDAVRWYLQFTTKAYDILRGLYFKLYKERDQMRTLARPIDLRKRDTPQSAFVTIATEPLIIIDHEYENWNILHVVNTGGDEKGPILLLLKGKYTFFKAEGDKVYMSLHDFPRELYYFTCATAGLAEVISNLLAKYTTQGVPVPRPADDNSNLEIVT